jgi:hypothetical protein
MSLHIVKQTYLPNVIAARAGKDPRGRLARRYQAFALYCSRGSIMRDRRLVGVEELAVSQVPPDCSQRGSYGWWLELGMFAPAPRSGGFA